MTRVERHVIKQKSNYYRLLYDFCHLSKNLYNHANYIVRNEFVNSGNWIRYNDLYKILKDDLDYPDYKLMPTAQSAQQTLKLLDKSWVSFFKSIKDYDNNKNKYKSKPNLPKYLSKNGVYSLILTNQNCKIKNNYVAFPKIFDGFRLKTKVNQNCLLQVRLIPKLNYIIAEIVYNIEDTPIKNDNNRYLSIDIGLSNFATITNNIGMNPIIVNGNGLKSINKYYNKLLSHYKSKSKTCNNLITTYRIKKIHTKRNFKVNDFIHKSSKFIINYAIKYDASKIIVGNNKDWKTNSKLSKIVNQSFVQIPYSDFINKLKYKAEEHGIELIVVEESYTSGTSFLDNELPIKENYNKLRRVKRGLFKSNSGKLINSDVNGSLQIMKKVFPNAYVGYGIEGLVLNPIKINI